MINPKVLRLCLMALLFTWTVQAQNRIAPTQIAGPPSVTRVLLIHNGVVMFVNLGTGFELDTSTNPPTLRPTNVPQTSGGVETRQRFVSTAGQTNFVLAGAPQPGSLVRVSVNGIEEDPNILAMSGSTLIFQFAPAVDSLVLVTYRR